MCQGVARGFVSSYKLVQFSSEYSRLSPNKSIISNSMVLRIFPFLNNQAIIRVGERMKLSDYDTSTATLFNIREHFWPISGRNLARKIVLDCICYFKSKP